jgi:hypothetical protein
MRFIIENLVREQFGQSAYLNLTHSSAYVTFREGLHLGLITQAEFDSAATDYGRLWNYVGD